MNLGRAQGRQTFAFFQALCAAKAERLPAAFFEPMSSSKEEAEDKAFDFNAARATARAKAGMDR